MTPRSLQVGMLTTAFPRFAGDLVGNFVFFFCRELARRGVRVTVVTPHTPGTAARETMEGVAVRRFRYLAPASLERVGYLGGTLTNLKQSWLARLGLPFYALGFWRSARRLARESSVLHAHWIPCGLAALASGSSRWRPPVVVSVWGTDVGLLRVPLLGRWARRRLRGAQAILAVSERMRSELVASGLPEDRMRVILTASTPLDVPAESRDAIRTRLRLPVERPVVLYLGRLSEVKGPRHLVAAAAEVLRHAPEAFFALVGDGPLELALRAAVRERGLEDSVLFAGFIPHDEVGHWLAAADVFVLPSLSEGLPHALIEAMSFALPVVASAVGGVPELVADGVNGRLVPPADEAALADALLGLIRDPHARLRFGEEARRGAAARRLTWERFADEVEAVYASISSSKTPSARSSQSK